MAAVEDVAGQRRHRRQFAQGLSELVVIVERVGDDRLVRIDPRQRCGELAARAFRHHEFGGRDVDPCEPEAVAAGGRAGARDRQQVIVGARIEQRVLGQRAGRDQPHHAAAHHALVAARFRGGGILGLLADRDPVAGRDQAVQIILGALDRNAAHRDVRALVLAALGQHDAERLGGDLGVLEEQFVEVAHPVEQQQALMRRLDLQVLFHHRRDARGGFRLRRGRFVGRRYGYRLLHRHGRRNLQNFVPRSYRFGRGREVFHAVRTAACVAGVHAPRNTRVSVN
ncbi:hypothetical protein ACVIJX_005694 [Bradyrhizobium diazoefficiens]